MKQRWHLFLGGLFLVWGICNTTILISRYGIEQGMFLWFCNTALLGTAAAFLLKDKSLVISFLSPLLFTQSIWVVENFIRTTFGKEPFGVVEFLYHPGLPLNEFILSHYHYFLIPFLFFALFTFENRKNYSARVILGLGVALFALSYFVFPAEQNINCAHAPCFPDMEQWKGKAYSIGFPTGILALSLIVARLLFRFFAHRTLSGARFRTAVGMLAVYSALSIFLIYWDVKIKKSIPSFSCRGPYEDEDVAVKCRYTTEYIKDWMVLVYEMKNKAGVVRECASYIEFEGKKELLQDNLFLEPGKTTPISILIHYPLKDTDVQLSGICQK